MKSFRFYLIIAITAIAIIAIAYVLSLHHFRNVNKLPTPPRKTLLPTSPIPRNVKMLFSGNFNSFRYKHAYTIIDVDEQLLNMIVFVAFSDEQLESHNNFCDCLELLEIFDKSIVEDFSSWEISRAILSEKSNNFVIDRFSLELSEEQLHDLWLKIDSVVLNYQVPVGFVLPIGIVMNAFIDGKQYRGDFIRRSTGESYTDESKGIWGSDMSLLFLAYFLEDLIPIQKGWERENVLFECVEEEKTNYWRYKFQQ